MTQQKQLASSGALNGPQEQHYYDLYGMLRLPNRSPTSESDTFDDIDSKLDKHRRLYDFFEEKVAALDLASLAVAHSSQYLPDQFDKNHRLVPVRKVDSAAIIDCTMPAGIETNYERASGSPFLDTKLAIGLTYNNILGAVGGASIGLTGSLVIKQLQGVNTADPTVKSGYQGAVRAGLMSGLAWRETLVRAWEHIAYRMQLPEVQIQSAANNSYRTRVPLKRLIQSYDAVASRMGYTHNPKTQDFHKTFAGYDV